MPPVKPRRGTNREGVMRRAQGIRRFWASEIGRQRRMELKEKAKMRGKMVELECDLCGNKFYGSKPIHPEALAICDECKERIEAEEEYQQEVGDDELVI
jgi:hypothetical protein